MFQIQETGTAPSLQTPSDVTPVEPKALERAQAKQRQKPLTTVTVQLTGTDGNAYAILATVRTALVRAGYRSLAARFLEEATASDYRTLLATCYRYVHVR